MSTLKVNAIESQAADSAPTIAGLQYPTAGPLSNRNIIINGAMQVGQRNNVANETAAVYGKVDRFRATVGGSTNKNYNFSQVTGCVPQEGFEFGLEYENINSVTLGANDFVGVSQIIEGQNLQSIRKGTTGALPITLSFWARSSRAGTYVVDLYDVDNDRQVGQSYSLDAGVWKYVVLTFPADTTGAFDNDNASSLFVNWWLGSGSDLAGGGSLNTSWQNNVQNQRVVGIESSFMTTAGSTFNLTGVQLELGDKATPFEHCSFGDELNRCKRYFSILSPGFEAIRGATGTVYSTANLQSFMQLPPMRVMPTLSDPQGNATVVMTGRTSAFVVSGTWNILPFGVNNQPDNMLVGFSYNLANNSNVNLPTSEVFLVLTEQVYANAEF